MSLVFSIHVEPYLYSIIAFIWIETQTTSHFIHVVRVSFYYVKQESLTYEFSLFWHSTSHTLGLSLLHHHSYRSSSSLCWIIHYNIVFETRKKLFTLKMWMMQKYPNPLKTRMWFNFSSLLNIDKIMCKYIRVRDGKTHHDT